MVIEILNKDNLDELKNMLEPYNKEIEAGWKNIENIKKILLNKYLNGEAEIIFLREEKKYVGFAVYTFEFAEIKNKGFVCEFYVKKEFRKNKAGSYLYNFIESEFKNKNLSGVWLTTDSAPEFWISQGFNPTNKIAKHNGCEIFEKIIN